MDISHKSQLIHAAALAAQVVKSELPDIDPLLTTVTTTPTVTTAARPTTILLATTAPTTTPSFTHVSHSVFPTMVHIKQEPVESMDTLQEQTGGCEHSSLLLFYIKIVYNSII